MHNYRCIRKLGCRNSTLSCSRLCEGLFYVENVYYDCTIVSSNLCGGVDGAGYNGCTDPSCGINKNLMSCQCYNEQTIYR